MIEIPLSSEKHPGLALVDDEDAGQPVNTSGSLHS
jgi:hypothetical protein